MTDFQAISLDDEDGDELRVDLGLTYPACRRTVTVATRANWHPHTTAGLSPDAARALAAALEEAAAEADALQLADDQAEADALEARRWLADNPAQLPLLTVLDGGQS